jgi:hypothetical protein
MVRDTCALIEWVIKVGFRRNVEVSAVVERGIYCKYWRASDSTGEWRGLSSLEVDFPFLDMRAGFNVISERVTDFDIFNRHANEAISQAGARLAQGYPVDIQASERAPSLANRLTFNLGCGFSFHPRLRHRIPLWKICGFSFSRTGVSRICIRKDARFVLEPPFERLRWCIPRGSTTSRCTVSIRNQMAVERILERCGEAAARSILFSNSLNLLLWPNFWR